MLNKAEIYFSKTGFVDEYYLACSSNDFRCCCIYILLKALELHVIFTITILNHKIK